MEKKKVLKKPKPIKPVKPPKEEKPKPKQSAESLAVKNDSIMVLIQKLDHQLKQINNLNPESLASLKKLKDSFKKSFKPLIEEALIPAKPREAKSILKQLLKEERLTPELLDEIRRSLAE